eukprot:2829954-Amphidinium_carterae.1
MCLCTQVRVIQSPARDVVLSSTSPSGCRHVFLCSQCSTGVSTSVIDHGAHSGCGRNQDEVRGRTVAPAPSTGSMHSSASGAELSRLQRFCKFITLISARLSPSVFAL